MAKFDRDPVLRGITRFPCPGSRVKTLTAAKAEMESIGTAEQAEEATDTGYR